MKHQGEKAGNTAIQVLLCPKKKIRAVHAKEKQQIQTNVQPPESP
jgi:hypothetical protein